MGKSINRREVLGLYSYAGISASHIPVKNYWL
jgi:hypothetical protein